MRRASFKKKSTKCEKILYLKYMYKKDLALNKQQLLICHKTKQNPMYLIYMYKEDLVLNNLFNIYV